MPWGKTLDEATGENSVRAASGFGDRGESRGETLNLSERKFMKRIGSIVILVTAAMAWVAAGRAAEVSGETKRWHKVTVTFNGPVASEASAPNPFRDYRLNVTFTHAATGASHVVPGYFAADGNAAGTSATSGNKWRVHFSPEATGTWTYVASFRQGADVAVALGEAGEPTAFDGERGSFIVTESDKSGADFRAKGRLVEVGQHYLQFAGTKEYFVKAGAGSPENFLAFADFDNTTAGKKPLHCYAPHLGDWRPGDPTWKSGKGKAIIGALNYLAGKKMNSLYFLTMNVGGDGDDVFPWTTKSERYRFDVSKLDQWEIVFSHMEKLGIHLHMVTQEQENDQLLDGGSLGLQRKLYYRELIARFGHHLGLTWNLGEENTNTAAQRTAFADYINALDPYQHLIAVHTFPADRDKVYTPMIGHPVISGASLQLQSPSIVHDETLKWVKKSAASGRKWVVAVDELGHASVGAKPDSHDASRTEIRHRVLWGSLLAGAGGLEWYFGYDYPHHDLTCEDWRSREKLWTQTHYAAQFIRDYMPLPLVANSNSLTSSTKDYCFGKPGVAYAIYLPAGETTNITLPAGETYRVDWFNPRKGGNLVAGTVAKVNGGTAASVGRPPSETTEDWVALLRRTESDPATPVPPPSDAMAVTKLTLVSAATQSDVRPLTNGTVVNLAEDGASLNLRADVNGKVGSVAFSLTGQSTKVENIAPYVMFGDDDGVYRKWTPAPGTYTLKAVPYSGANRTGAVGVPLEVTFTVVKAIEAAPKPEEPAKELAVARVMLVSAAMQSDVRELTNGAVVNLAVDGTKLNIRADIQGTAGSVAFAFSGQSAKVENIAPYVMFGDDSGKYRPWTPAPGVYTLRVTPYAKSNCGGEVGEAKEVTFTVVNEVVTEPETPEPPPIGVLAVTRLVLVDAATQRDIRALANGDTIRLGADGAALNVRAEVSGVAGSVRFAWDGKAVRTENTAPYAFAADDDGIYRAWKPATGTHVLRAAPYAGANAGGKAGVAFEVRLNVVQ